MPYLRPYRVAETTTTTGTGSITLAGAVTGYASFAAELANADTATIVIEAIDSAGRPTGDYEICDSTFTSPSTLSRGTLRDSSTGSRINFAAGSKRVFAINPRDAVDLGSADLIGTLPVAKGGTGSATFTSGRLLVGQGSGAVTSSLVSDNGTTVTVNGSIAVTAGSIDGTTVGATTTSTGAFTTLSATGAFTTGSSVGFNSLTAAMSLGGNHTTGVFTIGGASGTGILTLGRSTVSQTTNIQAGATASGSTKTINLGTEGLAGSTTAIAIGSTAGTSNTTINGNVGIGSTPSGTYKLQVTGAAFASSMVLGAALPVGSGGTGATTLAANNVLLGNGTSALQAVAPGANGNVLTSNGTTWVSSAAAGGAVSYPQNIQSADYTLVLGDAGKQIFHPASDTNRRTYTIPSNASVAFPIGTVVLFAVENNGQAVTVKITSDILVFGNGTTGNVVVPANQTLMAIKITSTKWMANYLYQTGEKYQLPQSIAVAHNFTPFITAYPWGVSGFGAKYSNPATLPTGNGLGVAFSPAGDAIAVAHNVSPRITAYPWSGSGFGTKFANPATLPPDGINVAFNPLGNAIAVTSGNTPFITAYPWSSSGFGTKFANPATLPVDSCNGVAFSPAGDAIAVVHPTSPRITAYPWSGSGFGTKFANPATALPWTAYGVAFNPTGDAIAVAHGESPAVTVYSWSGSGFGTKYTNPSTVPSNEAYGVTFNPVGDTIAVSGFYPYITAYPWSGSGFGTKFADPVTLPAGNGRGVAFSPAGNAIAVAHINTPFVTAYPWSGSGFGTKFANPATLPAGDAYGVAFTINP